jgi:hypothetical protein
VRRFDNFDRAKMRKRPTMSIMKGPMKAVVLEAPGPPEALQIRDVPIPTTGRGEVLIKVAASA